MGVVDEMEILKCYKDLAMGIVKQCIEDYMDALKVNDECGIGAARYFFRSGWAAMLCGDLDPMAIQQLCERKVRKRNVKT